MPWALRTPERLRVNGCSSSWGWSAPPGAQHPAAGRHNVPFVGGVVQTSVGVAKRYREAIPTVRLLARRGDDDLPLVHLGGDRNRRGQGGTGKGHTNHM